MKVWTAAKRESEFLFGPAQSKSGSKMRRIIVDYFTIIDHRESHQTAFGRRIVAEIDASVRHLIIGLIART
jgi:hypothetical protein